MKKQKSKSIRYFYAKSTQKYLILLCILFLAACATTLPIQKPTAEIQRTAETPLVAAIPGLNFPPAGDQRFYYGDLNGMLAEEGIPSIVVLYDSKRDEIRSIADLSSEERSIAILRILPRLATALSQENQIRSSQGLPPLKNLDFVGYSQGSVLVWDLVRRLVDFDQRFKVFKEAIGDEWDRINQDPIYEALNDAILNYFLIYNVRIQTPETFEKSLDAQNIFYRAERNTDKAIERMRTYLRPEAGVRPYPRIVKWLDENYDRPQDTRDLSALLSSNLFIQYAAYKNLLPLDIRFFSIAGSFYGAEMANKADFYETVAPWLANRIIGNRDAQIKDTRLGGRYHLEWTKGILDYRIKEGKDPYLHGVYFIVGVNGRNGQKGDGFIEQSAAHISRHYLTQVPLETVLDHLQEGGSESSFTAEWLQLPEFPVTGLPVQHMPKKGIIFKHLGAGEMTPKSKVFPFLKAFVKRDADTLKALHEKHHHHLRQFMVALYLPLQNKDLKLKDFSLKEISKETSKGVKIARPYYRSDANSMVWLGHFKEEWQDWKMEDDYAEVALNISADSKGKGAMHFRIYPGKNHFIEILEPESEVAK